MYMREAFACVVALCLGGAALAGDVVKAPKLGTPQHSARP